MADNPQVNSISSVLALAREGKEGVAVLRQRLDDCQARRADALREIHDDIGALQEGQRTMSKELQDLRTCVHTRTAELGFWSKVIVAGFAMLGALVGALVTALLARAA